MIAPIASPGISYRPDASPVAQPAISAPHPAGASLPTPSLAPSPRGALITGPALTALAPGSTAWTSDAAAWAAARAADAYGLAAMPQVSALAPVPPREPLQEASGLGFIPGEVFTSRDPARLTEYLRGQVAEARELARREAELSEAAGVPLRLAYDPNTGGVVELRPGDPDYARLKGAQAMYARMPLDLQKMGQQLAAFRDLLPA